MSQAKRITVKYYENSVLKRTMYYLGNYEKEVVSDGSTKEYDYICTPEGLSAIAVKTNGSRSFYYVQTDHLGSIRVVTTASKAIQTRYYYDARGKQTLMTGTDVTGRGYLAQEHLNDFGLINLNARLYDPVLARFMGMDPYVQAPDFTQSYNRYSYGLNNPHKYTDANGENPFLIVGGFLLAKWYYDGYKANNGRWNPLKWDWKNVSYTVGYSTSRNTVFGGVGWGTGYSPLIGYGNGSWAMGYSQNGNKSFYYPGYNYNAPEQAAAKGYENARQSMTPWGVGWEWLTGTGPRDRTFYEGDYFTELLRQHDHIGNTRNMLIDNFQNGNFENGRTRYDLRGIQGVGKYIRDYSTLATVGLTGNLAVTYLGSYDVKYTVLSTNQNPALVQFKVTNASTMASGIRPPVIGYWSVWQDYIGPFINRQFSRGPMSEKTQTFIWNEYIYW